MALKVFGTIVNSYNRLASHLQHNCALELFNLKQPNHEALKAQAHTACGQISQNQLWLPGALQGKRHWVWVHDTKQHSVSC